MTKPAKRQRFPAWAILLGLLLACAPVELAIGHCAFPLQGKAALADDDQDGDNGDDDDDDDDQGDDDQGDDDDDDGGNGGGGQGADGDDDDDIDDSGGVSDDNPIESPQGLLGGATAPTPQSPGLRPETDPLLADMERSHPDRHEQAVQDELLVVNGDPAFFPSVKRLGFSVIERRSLETLGIDTARLRIPPSMTLSAARSALSQLFPGTAFDVNGIYRPRQQLVLPSPDYPKDLIGWPATDPACDGAGANIRIGMVDAPVDASLSAFQDSRIEQRSFVEEEAGSDGHGTAVASILVGEDGLLPDARLLAAAVFRPGSDGRPLTTAFDIAAALDWLMGQEVGVVNMSFTGDANLLLSVAMARVDQRGIVAVAAAGNGGPSAPPAYPASYDSVIGVTAVDYRRELYGLANQGDYVDFAAPGVRVSAVAPDGRMTFVTGTSFATPFVSAAVARILAAGIPAESAAVREALSQRAVDLGEPGYDPKFGWGLIQAADRC